MDEDDILINADEQLFQDILPSIYSIVGSKSQQYVSRVANLFRTYPPAIARLLSLIYAAVDIDDYKAWNLDENQYNSRIREVFGSDDSTELGRIGSMLRVQNDHISYSVIMDQFTDEYFESNGAESASIRQCLDIEKTADTINRSVHNTAVLKDIASIMSTMNKLSQNTPPNISTPYDALFNVNRLGAKTGAISDVYLARYLNSIPMIMKTNDDYNFQLHEYIVGLKVNELRSTIANFVYTYGYSKVLNPLFSNSTFIAFGLYDAININDRQVYIEYLSNAVTLSDVPPDFTIDVYIRKSDSDFPRVDRLSGADVFEVVFLQLMSALFYAWKKIGFAHRDLNPGNIMLVNLNQLTAIPIMVPAGIDEQTGDIIFVRRWLITDVLVVIIDYGYSSVEIQEYRDKYNTRVISPISVYGLFEGTTTIENDFLFSLRYLYRKFGASNSDFVDMISLFYTGSPATEQMKQYPNIIIQAVVNMSGGAYIYPELQYYIERTVIKYCVKYANKWSQQKYDTAMFRSIIADDVSTLSTANNTVVTDSRQMYLVLRDESNDYDVHEESVIANEWYRQTYVEPSLADEANSTNYVTWMMKFFKWTNTFQPINLNMLPLTYSRPLDFVRRAYNKVRGSDTDNQNILSVFAQNQVRSLWRY